MAPFPWIPTLLAALFFPPLVQSQTPFPPLFNTAQNRPVTSIPAASTCGQSSQSAYCQSTTSSDSLTRCIQSYCSQACPNRSGPPPSSSTFLMLSATSPGTGDCVLADTVNVRPGSLVGQFSTAITRAGPTCYLTPVQRPRLDASREIAFTIISWVWMDTQTTGTLLEKQSYNGSVLFSLQLSTSGLTLVYGSLGDEGLSVSVDLPIQLQTWTHVTLQVQDVTASVFINGPGPDLSASATVRLLTAMNDGDGFFRVGQSKNGSVQFIGRLQDLTFYTLTLTNREVAQLYSGTFPAVRVQSECRCPGTYPRVKPGQTQYCIKNGEPVTTSARTPRVSGDSHPLEYINDGDSSTLWISTFINQVDIEVDLGDQFQVFYVVLQFYSPFPKAVTVFKQSTENSSLQVWQYYADDCRTRFNLENNGALTAPDSFNCLQFGTNGASNPYSLGNITLNLLAPDPVARPGSRDFFNTPELHEFVRARKVRLRFEDHYYVTNIRHQYFALYELMVTAWCDCNGHASQCNTSSLPYTCNCMGSSYTEGNRCQRCQPLYNNKPYRKGDNLRDYPCLPCSCNGHASSCVYNASLDTYPDSPDQGGGGVCVNCQHFTTSRFCDTCLPGYFRPTGVSLYDPAVCQPCNCLPAGIVGGVSDCNQVGGQCLCKTRVQGRRCDTCQAGFYGLDATNPDGCRPCSCNMLGVQAGNMSCDQTTGQCQCKANVTGQYCDQCSYGYYGLSGDKTQGCSACDCNPVGSSSIYCNPSSGQCQCKARVDGLKCDMCRDGFYSFNDSCLTCSCNQSGSQNGSTCDKVSGQCSCKQNVRGIYCDQCKEGTFSFGSSQQLGCQACQCLLAGTVNGSGLCDRSTGACSCKPNVEGAACNKCKPNTWGLNVSDPGGCQSCDCDPTGTLLENRTVCDQNTGQCSCLAYRSGRRCESCTNGTYINPSGGCLPCSCHPTGTLSGTSCNTSTGQCECKQGDFGVAGKTCDQCMATFYGFNVRLGSCTPCNCLEAGSLNLTCNSVTGQCPCKTFVTGRSCGDCVNGSSQMDANNPFGCSTAPSQQPPPQYRNRTSHSLVLIWGPPDFPNGVLSGYRIYRNQTLIGNTTASVLTYEDVNLLPFTYYTYEIEAFNANGFTKSAATTFQTLAGKPSSDIILNVTDIRALSALCNWTTPSNMNGPLLKYVVASINESTNTSVTLWEGTTLSTTLTSLSPYTRYNLTVLACTEGGCASSAPVQIGTLSAPPAGQQPPVITALSSSELMVTWQPPLFPNGIISFYELWFRGPIGETGQSQTPESIIFNPSGRYDPWAPGGGGSPLGVPATSFNVTGLQPFTSYQLKVTSQNDAGKATSDWAQGRTLEAAPISLAPPSVLGISSSQLLVSWSSPPPASMQGSVLLYRLYQNMPQNILLDPFGPPYLWQLVYTGDGGTLNTTISGLTPYTEHSFILEACNSKGCVNSTAAIGRTLIAAPEGVQKPAVTGFNTTVMELQWKPPLFPNGPAPVYKVQKTNIALSYPASVIRGTRFTGGGYYAFPASVLPQNVAFTGVRLKFRLERGTGTLLFSGTNTQQEFMAIQFVGGRPRFMFDTQGCQNFGFITTTDDEGLVYNDRQWHALEVRRTGGSGTILVDEKWTGVGTIRDTACLNSSIIGDTTAVYVGGFPPDFVLRRTDRSKRVETTPLQGCIDSLEILQQVYPEEIWKPVNWSQGLTNDLEFLNWQGCPINLEAGIHFMGKGYLVLSNCENNACSVSGNIIRIHFRIRTELHTGLLFLLYGGTGIYIYGTLENGRLNFVISNSVVKTVVTYDDPSVNFCDGQWREVHFDKVGQQASITLTSAQTISAGDPNLDMSLSLVSDIFLGGLKVGSDADKYGSYNNLSLPVEGFGGCFSGFQINGKQYDTDMIIVDVANVNLDGCPPYYQSTSVCQSSLITQVYQGVDTVAYDTGLLPFTDYIYRVAASNDAGEGTSSWAYGRTREGAPSGVRGPSSVRALSGLEIEVVWGAPQATYGLLTKYVVKAYDMDDNTTFVSQEVLDVSVTAINMTGVVPDTQYLVRIVACTPGGCTESEDGMNVTTPIEAPEDVPTPSAQPSPTSLYVQWQPPGKPNGPITGYILYQEGRQVYSGGELGFNVTGLQVYTAYSFYISACTVAGCTNGPTVALSTSQLPPGSVGQPRLQVLDTSRIKASWDIPSMLNGVLESFLLYQSTMSTQTGQVVYNSTDLSLGYTLTNLTAGTTYYITLGACTGGGCTLGAAANATTEESAPDGVPPPVAVSPDANTLVVTWASPLQPNGLVVNYQLYDNGRVVYTGLDLNYTLSGLLPFSQHVLQVKVCTAQGCAFSDEVMVRTQETAPQGLIVLTAAVVNARTANVSWTLPAQMNGNMSFRVFFTGLFYVNPDTWNYSTVLESRPLLQAYTGYTVYQVAPLVPMSNYTVQVNGSNSVGFVLSNSELIMMPAGTPDGMAPPDLISETPRSIKVTWKPVGRVNAPEVVSYLLQFMETTPNSVVQNVFGPTVTFNFNKTDLQPFTEYKFRVAATNSLGQGLSPWATLVTRQDKPSSMNVPLVVSVKSKYVDITWSVPMSPNGIISQYNIYLSETLRASVADNTTSLRVDGLVPFTVYNFSVEVCTVAGCTKSLPSANQLTLPDIPESLSQPELLAMSPSAIQIKYSDPGRPNGLVSQFLIERRDPASQNITLVASRTPDMARVYIDQSSSLSPFSTYSYRVNVQNQAGTALGPFADIQTGTSFPAGLQPPLLTSLSPWSVLVNWSAPSQPNGQIEIYVLRFPEPRIEVRNLTQLSMVVSGLTAFTAYTVTVTACTSAGCTESAPTNLTTNASSPAGQDAPRVTAVSQSQISVWWQPPSSPNGPNISYELTRLKVSQPLEPTASDLGVWQSLYSGQQLMFQDVGLPLFTSFLYRVTAFNSLGQTTSPNSSLVTTFGGLPTLPPNVTAIVIDHLSIFVNWTLPSPTALQGQCQNLTLVASSNDSQRTVHPDPDNLNWTLTGLDAHTLYTVTLTLTIFGGASVTSAPVQVTTLDGAPAGLSPPKLSVVSQTSLRVSWTAPIQPKGEIINYKILVNDRIIDTGLKTAGSVVVDSLQPYTVYNIRVEACTVLACIVSDIALGTTAEAPPQMLGPPQATPITPTQINVSWVAPYNPNGVIQRYELWRKSSISCSNVTTPVGNTGSDKCQYVVCGVLESVCGTTCYTGNKVCCDGVLHDAIVNYSCCGSQYILKSDPSYICCDGKFYESKVNYKCCGTRFVEVLPGEVCCPDSLEDRLSISQGDTCCGGVPFLSSGAQLCCQGSLTNKLGSQCCGGAVISDTTVCCGEASQGLMYLQQPGYSCCGRSYVPASTTLCCTSGQAESQVHVYGSEQEKLAAADKCCGLSRVTSNLACCHISGYNPASQVCADRSSQDSDCGSGVVCPITQASSAFCDRCDFDVNTSSCKSSFSPASEPPPNTDPDTPCVQTLRVYSGLNLTYMDSSVSAYTQYLYYIVAVNSAGSVSSDITTVTSLEDVPQKVHPPYTKTATGELYVIYLTWQAPDMPNGVIKQYILRRDGFEVYRGSDMNFTDSLSILPFRSYSYALSACNSAGCGNSSAVSMATAQTLPEDLPPPLVWVINSTTLGAQAQPPGKPNGVLVSYSVSLPSLELFYNSTDPQQFFITDLTPFTSYSLESVVCTVVGCAVSPMVNITTLEDLPEGLLPPRIIVVNSTSVEVYWQAPYVTNGNISNYKIIQTQPAPVSEIYSGMDLALKLTTLTPGQSYTYQLQASNGAGSVLSEPRQIIMPTTTPVNVPPPQNVTVLSSTSIRVRWNPVVGDIDQYRVILNPGQATEEERGVGLQTNVTIVDLQPYTLYEVRLQACLRNVLNGCGTSSAVVVRTQEDKPAGMEAPRLEALASDTVRIVWNTPSQPNGLITFYRVYQQRPNVSNSEILVNQVPGNVFDFLHSGQDLKPFQVFEYKVVAINSKGEVASNWSSVRTGEAPPANVSPPSLTNVSTYGLSLSWLPPASPNGVIKEYRIYWQASASPQPQWVGVAGSVTSSAVSGLQANSNYQVWLEAINGAGSSQSAPVLFTTREGFPQGLSPLAVEKITQGTAVILSWSPPKKPNGAITMYRVYQSNYTVPLYSGIALNYEFRRLTPYTQYFVQLEACTRAGCTLGPEHSFFTAEVAPTSQPSPTLGSVNTTHVVISWQPPLNPNGAITSYQVLRTSQAIRQRRSSDSVTRHFSIDNFSLYSCSMMNPNSACLLNSNIPNSSIDMSATLTLSHPDLNSISEPDETLEEANGLILHRVKRQAAPGSSPEVVYTTSDTSQALYQFTDSGLKPYTIYQYSVRASNSLGHTDSPWLTVQTEQAAPDDVQPPVLSPVGSDSNSIDVSWAPPSQTNGVLQSYQIQRNSSVPLSFPPNAALSFRDTGLVAYTIYSYRLTACTSGGCSTSQPATIRTPEAPPLVVSPPFVDVLNSTTFRLNWSQPQLTNGILREFQLKMDGQVILVGLQTAVIITNLTAYEAHTFSLVACTSGGCTESSEVTARTDEAPPSGLAKPVLQVMSSTSIEVTWLPPSNPNGVILSYDLKRNGNLIYTSSITVTGTLATSFRDYSLLPAIEYSYSITARNRKGSVDSEPATARTYSSSPTGLSAPVLTPVSPTSIRVDWSPPSNPNGVLVNYTIYQGSQVVVTVPPSQLSYTVAGLLVYTLYTFSLEACTQPGCQVSLPTQARTLEAAPDNQPPPVLMALANQMGANDGVLANWSPPAKPNGEILSYELYRQEAASDSPTPALVYQGSNRTYTDSASQLLPYTQYKYRVVAVNAQGRAGSDWASVTTREEMPNNVPPPVVNDTTSTSITVIVRPPEKPNGKITLYSLLDSDTPLWRSVIFQPTVTLSLTPSTTYLLKVQACTSVGCASSPSVQVDTNSSLSTQLSIQVSSSSSVNLTWSIPTSPNGSQWSYEVNQRTACPPAPQPFSQSCPSPGLASRIYSGSALSYLATGLSPYTAYQFQLTASQDSGSNTLAGAWQRVVTLASTPVYKQAPALTKNSSHILMSWKSSFDLNDQLVMFNLTADGMPVFTGVSTEFVMQRPTKNQNVTFVIKALTVGGEAVSPPIVFDLHDNQDSSTQAPVAQAAIPFYQEVWFIVLMCFIALLILFIILAIIIWRCCARKPYMRERKPLFPPPQDRQTAGLYVVDSRDGSIIDRNGSPPAKVRHRDNIYQGPGVGVINPAFSQDGQLARSSPGKTSWPSSKFIDDDDDDPRWRRQFDSGLFDDMDDESLSGQTYSYTKEQTVFTDTHL